jgi:hypothetical protein
MLLLTDEIISVDKTKQRCFLETITIFSLSRNYFFEYRLSLESGAKR